MTGPLEFDVPEWRAFLQEWNAEVAEFLPLIPPHARDRVVEGAIARGSILREPATDEAIHAAEQVLGVALPESLKRFYRASNGMSVIGLDAQSAEFWPVDRLSPLIQNERELVEIWTAEPMSPPDEEYFNYGPGQRSFVIRSEYLQSLIQLTGWVDAAALLINPKVVDQRGEWEAWFFGVSFPGAMRFRSFEDMMIKVRARTVRGMREVFMRPGR